MLTKKSLQNLSALMILSAIDKYQSKRKVAEVINTSTDTVNKYISNLEYALGLQLVVNNTKGCRLTKHGLRIAEQVKDVQVMLDRICGQRSGENKYKGDVCVCKPMMISRCLFPFNFDKLYDEYPDINVVSFSTLESPEFEEMAADIGIVTVSPELTREFTLLYKKKVRYCFFAAPKYIDKYGYPNDIDDLLQNHRIISCLQNTNHIPGWARLMQNAKKICFSSTSTCSVLEAMRSGLGIGLLPQQFKNNELVCLEKLKFHFELTIYLVLNNNTKDLPRVKVVAECYKTALSEM